MIGLYTSYSQALVPCINLQSCVEFMQLTAINNNNDIDFSSVVSDGIPKPYNYKLDKVGPH